MREYTEKYYVLAASAYDERAKDDGACAAKIVAWRRELAERWETARFGPARLQTNDGYHDFVLSVHPGDLSPESVQVELYAGALPGGAPERHVMTRQTPPQQASANGFVYTARVPATRPAIDYTPRLVPRHDEAIVPLEASQILWQR